MTANDPRQRLPKPLIQCGATLFVLVCSLALCGCLNRTKTHYTDEELDDHFMPKWLQTHEELAVTGKPFLWIIDDETPSFLYGTVHLPDDRILALPEVVEVAFEASAVVCLEVNLDAGSEARMREATRLREGEKLEDLIGSRLYERTESYFATKHLQMKPYKEMKVWAVAIHVEMADYLVASQLTPSLDKMLYNNAMSQAKRLVPLESIDEHFAGYDSLPAGDQIRMLSQALGRHENAQPGDSPTDRFLRAYLEGDQYLVEELLMEDFEKDRATGGRLYDAVLTSRDDIMIQRITRHLQQEGVHFFAVGTGHLVRPDGIVERLQNMGYSIRRLTAEDTPSLRKKLGVAVTE